MKVLLVLLLITFVSANALASNSPRDDRRCTLNHRKCSDDCSGIILCPMPDQPIKVSCNDQSGGTLPYCNTDKQQCDSVNKCELPPDTMCTLPNDFYPDLLNCSKYYYCNNYKKESFECENANEKYNPINQNCDTTTVCYTFTGTGTGRCAGKAGKLVSHPLTKTMYIHCGSKPTLFVCLKGKDGYFEFDFDEKSAGCNLACTAEGKFVDPRGDEYYYECDKQPNGTFLGSERKCPTNFRFQPDATGTNGKCVHKTRETVQ